MSFIKIVLLPNIIAALIAFPLIMLLDNIGWFYGLSITGSLLTGISVAFAGWVVGYAITRRLI